MQKLAPMIVVLLVAALQTDPATASAAARSVGAQECDVAVIGAGPGGVYVATRYAAARPQEQVCLFEQGARVGGRVHSMRHQGPKQDLVRQLVSTLELLYIAHCYSCAFLCSGGWWRLPDLTP